MDTQISYKTLKTKQLPQEDFQILIDTFADIYILNCGISLGFRTVAYDCAIALIEGNKGLGFHDAVDYFMEIMDKKDRIHRDYDICLLPDEKFENNFIKLCDDYPQLKILY